MKYGKIFLTVLMCLVLAMTSLVFVYADDSVKKVDDTDAISSTSVSFVRYAALRGKLTVSSSSTTSPDDMYAMVMLQKRSGTTWSDIWSSQDTLDGGFNGASGFTKQVIYTVESSGVYRAKVYMHEVDGNVHTIAGPTYSQSASL